MRAKTLRNGVDGSPVSTPVTKTRTPVITTVDPCHHDGQSPQPSPQRSLRKGARAGEGPAPSRAQSKPESPEDRPSTPAQQIAAPLSMERNPLQGPALKGIGDILALLGFSAATGAVQKSDSREQTRHRTHT
jgi:hypothetical protein